MPVWSPDGTRFAFTMDEKTIVLSTSQGDRQTFETAEPLSGEMTGVLMANWRYSRPGTPTRPVRCSI